MKLGNMADIIPPDAIAHIEKMPEYQRARQEDSEL